MAIFLFGTSAATAVSANAAMQRLMDLVMITLIATTGLVLLFPQLVDEVRVPLDPTFRLVTDPDLGLTASVTPLEDGCELYVAGKSTTELVVRSSRGEDCRFDYVVYGLRIGFEDVPAIRPKDVEAKVPSMRATCSNRPLPAANCGALARPRWTNTANTLKKTQLWSAGSSRLWWIRRAWRKQSPFFAG